MKSAIALLAFIGAASALCPNSCSGHGVCGSNDACTCDFNYVGADCSQRTCPYGLSFADQPLGDLDHSGSLTTTPNTEGTLDNSVLTQFSNKAVHESFQGTKSDEAHFYAECSGKGTCNRQSGECSCFSGYTGSSCQRTACPNDCSGHGRCRTIGEIAAGQLNKRENYNAGEVTMYSGVTAANYGSQMVYTLWDADKNQACVCDAGYAGADCTLRLCPRGDDPLTTGARYNNGDATNDYDIFSIEVPTSGTYKVAFGFTDWSGRTTESYTEDIDAISAANIDTPLTTASIAGKLLAGLRSMPGGMLQTATVLNGGGYTAGTTTGARVGYKKFAFQLNNVGGTRKDFKLQVSTIDTATSAVTDESAYVTHDQIGNTELVECSNRGLCDYSSGLCSCFAGYYGVSCEHQNALASGGRSNGPATIAAVTTEV